MSYKVFGFFIHNDGEEVQPLIECETKQEAEKYLEKIDNEYEITYIEVS